MYIPRLNLRCDVIDSFVKRDDGEIEIDSIELRTKIKDVMGLDIREVLLGNMYSQLDCTALVGYNEDRSMLFRFSDDGWFVLELSFTESEYQKISKGGYAGD